MKPRYPLPRAIKVIQVGCKSNGTNRLCFDISHLYMGDLDQSFHLNDNWPIQAHPVHPVHVSSSSLLHVVWLTKVSVCTIPSFALQCMTWLHCGHAFICGKSFCYYCFFHFNHLFSKHSLSHDRAQARVTIPFQMVLNLSPGRSSYPLRNEAAQIVVCKGENALPSNLLVQLGKA